MAKSKHHKNHKQKVNQFKQKVMTEQNVQTSIPKTHLLPQPEWQSDTMLEVRGDLFQAFDQALNEAFAGLQKAGQAYQQIIAHNIKAEKMKLAYVWNNGQPATEQEVKEYEATMQKIQAQRLKQAEEMRAAVAASEAEGGVVGEHEEPAVGMANEAASAVAAEAQDNA